MTLRLNIEAGKHRAFKGETKLDNKQHRAGDKLTKDTGLGTDNYK